MRKANSVFLKYIIVLVCYVTPITAQENPQKNSGSDQKLIGCPVVLDNDTLFNIYAGIGPFSAQKRASEISAMLKGLAEDDSTKVDSIKIVIRNGTGILKYNSSIIMAITADDSIGTAKSIEELGNEYVGMIKARLILTKEIYSSKSLIEKILYIFGFFVGFILLMWLNRLIFPKIYSALENLGSKIFKSVRIGKYELLKGSALLDLSTILAKGLRLFITLAAIYSLIVFTVTNLPWTRHWHIQPILRGVLLFVFVSVAAFALLKGVNLSYRYFVLRFRRWKGTVIKSFRFKSIDILSEDKAVDMLELVAKVIRIFIWIIIGYFYITLVFSFFEFSQTWAAKLIEYILGPLDIVLMAVVNFLPSLFFIIVIIFVFNYLLKFVRYFFSEIEKGNLVLPGFHVDWAIPTYKIVRFLLLILAVIIIFPHLPGSDSDAFKGVSVFLGIMFSFGSSSAISNIVSGTVLTYMRPFKIGDRVKIADTIGDVVEKTLLVTRVRTIKNIDITIPNSMVLGSHIINYSSASKEIGLILNTKVTIGYDAPWKQVHQLLIAAAEETDNIMKQPQPFVYQTSLDDFSVSYELNAYTDKPQMMAKIYSQIHQNIQDKFNEAGIQIMSPHFEMQPDQPVMPAEFIKKTN